MANKYLYPDEPSRFEPRHLSDFLVFCARLNTSDITIQTEEPIFAEIHGRLHKLTKRSLSNTEAGELLNGIYGANGTTQLMSGTDVDTHYEVRPNRNERYRFRVNGTSCHVNGHEAIQITLRIIPSMPPSLSDLSLPSELEKSLTPNDGVVYITGATGSGKSTLLAAIMRELLEAPESHRKILTYESPIEFVYDNIEKPHALISQTEIPRHLDSFATGVRNALRRKPHAILVGETRDASTINAVMEAAMTGHPVYTTLHCNGVSDTIRRLVASFPRDEQMARSIDIIETMRVVLWQKLVPSVDGKRVPLREYLVFNEEIRDKLLKCNMDNITHELRKMLIEHGQPMHADIEHHYKNGAITERLYNVLMRGLKQD